MYCIFRPAAQFQLSWFWVNRASGYWVQASTRFSEHFLHPCAYPCGADGHMAITLPIYRPRQFQWTWFEVSQPGGCRVLAFAKLQEHLLYLWACPCGLDEQITMKLCIYRARQFQLPWFGVNLPSGSWVPPSTIFQETLLCQWAYPYGCNGHVTIIFQIYRPRWFQWTWFGVNWPSGCWVMALANLGLVKRWINGWMDGDNSIVPVFFLGKGTKP